MENDVEAGNDQPYGLAREHWQGYGIRRRAHWARPAALNAQRKGLDLVL